MVEEKKPFVPLLIVMMVITGTANTLLLKHQLSATAEGSDGTVHKFSHPWIQTGQFSLTFLSSYVIITRRVILSFYFDLILFCFMFLFICFISLSLSLSLSLLANMFLGEVICLLYFYIGVWRDKKVQKQDFQRSEGTLRYTKLVR